MIDEMRRLQRMLNQGFWSLDDKERLALPNKKELAEFRTPLTDLEEKDNEVIARFEIPGVEKKDIQLNVTDRNIEVKVERKKEEKSEEKGYFRAERSYMGFYKAMSLPAEVLPDKAKAKYKDGVLEVVMSKSEKSGKKSRVEIE